LTAILGWTEYLLSSDVKEEHKEHLNVLLLYLTTTLVLLVTLLIVILDYEEIWLSFNKPFN
jgi:hypothetical protein